MASSPHRSRRSPSPQSSRRRRDRSRSVDRSSRKRNDHSRSPSRDRRRHSHSKSSIEKRSRHNRSRSPSKSRHHSSRHHRSRSPSEHKHRSSRHRSKSPARSSRSHRKSHSKHKRRDSSVSSYTSDSSASDSSDSEVERKRRHHKKHKKDKKSKKSKKKSKKSKLSIGDQWGKYGIIHEADIFTKEAEFQAWLIEVKNANVETLNNIKRKEMFMDFMEDYNTATMPHEKFYNLHQWERQQEAIRMGEKLPITTRDSFNFREDEERLKAQHRLSRQAEASLQPTLKLSEEQIKELTRINRERIEADRMRKMGLKPKESMGVRYEDEEQM